MLLAEVLIALTSMLASSSLLWGALRLQIKKDYLAKDLHKIGERYAFRLGGIAVLGGFYAGCAVALACFRISIPAGLIASTMLFALIGVVDDMIGLTPVEKVTYAAIASVPVVAVPSSIASCSFIVGKSTLLAVAFSVLLSGFTANAVNTLAGYNGLEGGVTSIMATAILVYTYVRHGSLEITLPLSALLGSLVGFLRYNRYPARAFPGNIGTFFMGGTLASLSIYSGSHLLLVVLLAPHSVDFMLKLSQRFTCREKPHAKVRENGVIEPPPYRSLIAAVLSKARLTEKQLVRVIILIEGGVAAAGVLVLLAL
ncbi:MAG: hypothetical protein DRN96_01955 [Thermoproteota archaeon]|nr:MAG: hypothetical protein DRN96_01955 [Candidatus Korarchaeota archaeon]RLG54347.1 MAG: hypothetical protein DRN99_05280 [Candidatus Korarchaeota archaeon]